MEKEKEQNSKLVHEIEEVKSLLQSLLIIEGRLAGLNRDQVRELAGVSTKRVSLIWGSINEKIPNKSKSQE